MVNAPKRACSDQPLSLLERPDEPAVITHLIDEPSVLRQGRQLGAFVGVQTERLLAKNMEVLIKRRSYHFTVEPWGSCDDDGVQVACCQYLSIVGKYFYSRILVQC